MQELLALAEGLPRRTLAPGEQLVGDGDIADVLYVLLEGALRIEKAGVAITTVAEPGACIGEMSLLLDIPATTDVVALEASVVAVADDARRRIDEDQVLSLALARMLASRLHLMTTYLADLKNQYAEHEGGLGMVDKVLGSLMRSPTTRTRLASERDPHPEY
ncbi:MAG: cyclic nucleotide binding protein [Actinomycetia bacterium]|nr:cyclic nucleotide binding protein [Actinomycetes bacterium]